MDKPSCSKWPDPVPPFVTGESLSAALQSTSQVNDDVGNDVEIQVESSESTQPSPPPPPPPPPPREAAQLGHVWSIKEFAEITDECVRTDFPSKSAESWGIKLELVCFPRAQLPGQDDTQVLANLRIVSSSQFSNVLAKYTISAVDARGKKCFHQEAYVLWREGKTESSGNWTANREALMKPELRLVMLKRLKLFCMAKLVINPAPNEHVYYVRPPPTIITKKAPTTLQDEMESLLQCGLHSDVVFFVEGRQFNLHKAILSIRSLGFLNMFENCETTQFLVEDLLLHVFEQMVRYIYCDKVDGMDDLCMELYDAAEMYEIYSLQDVCIEHMTDNLSVETVITTLLFAHENSLKPLKAKCFSFVKAHQQAVMSSPSWNDLRVQSPKLTRELVAFCKTSAFGF